MSTAGCTVLLLVAAFALGFAGTAGAGAPQPAEDPRALQKRIRAQVAAALKAPRDGEETIRKLLAAAQPGSTVKVPAGCYRISSSISVPPGVRLTGAGLERTVLYRDPAKSANSRGSILHVRAPEGAAPAGLTQIAGMSFVGVTSRNDKGWDCAVSLRDVRDFRVDHCCFDRFGSAAVSARGLVR
ncbi:MAG: hypothetical protein ACYTGB_17290, partial [Planctomycetota bacterium]